MPIGHNRFVPIYRSLYAIYMKSFFCVPFFPFKWIAKHTLECICNTGYPSFASRNLSSFFCEFCDFSYIETRITFQSQSFYGNHIICNHSNSNLFWFDALWILILSVWMITELLSRLLTNSTNSIESMRKQKYCNLHCHLSSCKICFIFSIRIGFHSNEYLFLFEKKIHFSDAKPFTFSPHSCCEKRPEIQTKRNLNTSFHEPMKKAKKIKRIQPICNLARWIFLW